MTSVAIPTLVPVFLMLAVGGDARERAFATNQNYAEVLDNYRRGEFEDAARTLLQWNNEDLLRSSRMFLARNLRPFRRDAVQAMLALQTELAIVANRSIVCEPNRVVRALTKDQKHSVELDRRDFLDLLEQNQPDDNFLEAWYSLAAAYNQGRGDLVNAMNCIRRAPDRLRNGASMLLALGAVHEAGWHGTVENGVSMHQIQPDLREATRMFEQAWNVARIPEARLRLARVLTLQDRVSDALTVLRSLPPLEDTALLYLQLLFEGDALERSGNQDAAERAYVRARQAMPGAQSATMALAHLQYARGSRASALDEFMDKDASAPTTATDPWLWYQKGTARRAAAYLEALRAIARIN